MSHPSLPELKPGSPEKNMQPMLSSSNLASVVHHFQVW